MGKQLISVVVPLYNEEAGVADFLDRQLMPVLAGLAQKVEVVLVDDGSTDKTISEVKKCKLMRKLPVKIVALTRNFGKEMALTAGLREASGDAVIMIDGDGQHPAEMIPKMIEKWQHGAEVVTAVRGQNTTKHKMWSRLYYIVMKVCGIKNVVPGVMDFRLLDREVVDEFNQFTERNRLTRGLIDWLGFHQEYIKVKTRGRTFGKPTYTIRKLISVGWDSVVSTSRTPLVVFGYIGVLITVVSLIFGLFILIEQYMMGDPMGLDFSGAVAISVFVAFLVGLVLISQSLTALYISQIHAESKNRPLYVVDRKKSVGLKDE